jgi:hypothetical protein
MSKAKPTAATMQISHWTRVMRAPLVIVVWKQVAA